MPARRSTGCGEQGCLLCQCNPSRLCKRNLRNKYLIDDKLLAKCNAPLRVELVDQTGACVLEGLPDGQQLEVRGCWGAERGWRAPAGPSSRAADAGGGAPAGLRAQAHTWLPLRGVCQRGCDTPQQKAPLRARRCMC